MNFTPAFWKWFGTSKVVDKHGQPLLVYHGARHDSPLSAPAWFTDNREEALGEYGDTLVRAYLRITRPYTPKYIEELFDDPYKPRWVRKLKRQGYDGTVAVEPFDYVPDGPGAAAFAAGYLRGIRESLG